MSNGDQVTCGCGQIAKNPAGGCAFCGIPSSLVRISTPLAIEILLRAVVSGGSEVKNFEADAVKRECLNLCTLGAIEGVEDEPPLNAEISGWGSESARRLEDYDLVQRHVTLLTNALKAHIEYFGGGSHRFDECPTPGECEECKVNTLATVALGEKV